MSDDNEPESIKKGSDNIVEGVNTLATGLNQVIGWLASWFNDHPLLKFIILAPLSGVIGHFGVRILSIAHIYFFGRIVPVGRDVKVQVFPAPVGFTLWILSTALILFVLLVYFRFVTLCRRIEDLERHMGD